jgi:2-octaprenylphenol hydroxylase
MSDYDVIVIGGGIVGATTALALAKKTALKIALIDAADLSPKWEKDKPAHRVSAISLASQRIFQKLNVWDAIQAKRVSPYKKMHVWDAEGKGELHFHCRDLNISALGYIIEDDVTRASLLEILAATSVDIIAPLQLKSFHEEQDGMTITAEDGCTLRAKLVIAADGAFSWVRDQADIDLTVKEYGHQAIVATVRTTGSHQMTAWQRFLPTGPLAFLPLSDENVCSIVWSNIPSQAAHLLALSDQDFQEALATAFEHKLGTIEAIGPRYCFDLLMRHAKHYVQPHLALVGDAAHTIHPLAGQGVNLGLLDAACLVDVIAEALAKKRDFSSLSTLRRYERWRKSDNMTMMTFVGGLKQLFASEKNSIQRLRNTGLSMVNQLGFLKHFFADYAVGNRGDIPELAKA